MPILQNCSLCRRYNSHSRNIDFHSIQNDLVNAEKRLNANRRSVNANKSCQMKIKIANSASNSNRLCDCKLNSVRLLESESGKYLGKHIDKNLSSLRTLTR